MEAKEFRVTNLILNDGIVNAIIFIGYDSVQLITPQGNNITARLELIKPIPLTEEWLVRFGFERYKDYNEFIKEYGNKCDFILFDHKTPVAQANDIKENQYYYWFHKTIHIIQYVHQLQNLYFALTGEELTIKNQ